MYYYNPSTISLLDRIISALSYVTAGWAGLIYFIIIYVVGVKRVSNFLRFNVVQSIFLSILYFVLSAVFGLLVNLLSHIPVIQSVVAWIQLLFFSPALFGLSVLQIFIDVLMLYLVLMSFAGKYPVIYKLTSLLRLKTY